MTRRQFCAMTGAGLGLVSCGYHVGGKADLVPKGIQTIAIPAFASASTRYRLTDALPQQIGREFIARTRFRIVENPNEADAVLNGRVNGVSEYPTIFDPTSGRATTISVAIVLGVNLVERATGRVLFSRPSLGFRESFDLAVDPHQLFDESGPAFDRLSRDVASEVVSAVIENF